MSENVTLNLSRHQYGTLKFIRDSAPNLAYLRKAHANTLGSLAYRGYLRRHGPGEEAVVLLTPTGEEAYQTYAKATLNERATEKEMTERCMRLLQLSRRRNVMSMPGEKEGKKTA